MSVLRVDHIHRPRTMLHRLRSAWCELRGGHDNDLLCARMRGEVTAVRLYCQCCGKKTMWYRVEPRTGLYDALGRN